MGQYCGIILTLKYAGMAELADAHGLGPCAERRAGSSPVPGTKVPSAFPSQRTSDLIFSNLPQNQNVLSHKACDHKNRASCDANNFNNFVIPIIGFYVVSVET